MTYRYQFVGAKEVLHNKEKFIITQWDIDDSTYDIPFNWFFQFCIFYSYNLLIAFLKNIFKI